MPFLLFTVYILLFPWQIHIFVKIKGLFIIMGPQTIQDSLSSWAHNNSCQFINMSSQTIHDSFDDVAVDSSSRE